MAFVQQDVLGLDVTMDDVMAVSVVERLRHFRCDAARQVDRQLPISVRSARTVWPSITGIMWNRTPSASPESWSGRMFG